MKYNRTASTTSGNDDETPFDVSSARSLAFADDPGSLGPAETRAAPAGQASLASAIVHNPVVDPVHGAGAEVAAAPAFDAVLPAQSPVAEGDVSVAAQADLSLIRLDQFRADPRFSGIDGRGVSVVVLDTGIDLDHGFFGPDANHNGVSDSIVYSYSFVGGNSGDASDRNGHGSNVASIIGSQNGFYAGMAPGVNIIALKVLADDGSGTTADIAEALDWVVANRAGYNIVAVNMSLGYGDNRDTPTFSPFASQFANLAANNTAVIVASGNSYASYQATGVATPSSDPNAWSIGAVWDRNAGNNYFWSSGAIDYTTGADHVISFSQRSPSLTTIFAPGGQITGANASGGTVAYSGTSQAAPHIAGLVADMQQLALRVSGHFLSVSDLKQDMLNGAAAIFDGDDEIDNVSNSSTVYWRVDALGWGIQVLNRLFAGTTGNDTLSGTSVADSIHGNQGADTLSGNGGDDTLSGDSGNDALFGDAGNDRLDGGTGNDTLIGGSGSDVLLYAVGSGADTVADFFHADGDKIDLTSFGYVNNLSDLVSRASQVGADTVIDFGRGDTLTVKNVARTALVASDFFFSILVESSGSSNLVQLGNTYGLFAAGGSSGHLLSFNGVPVTVGQYGSSWTVIGAEQVGVGYHLAWKYAPTDQYVIWNLNSGGGFVSNTLGTLFGTSLALQAQEPIFQQDLNGDGTIGPITTMIETAGSTDLAQVADTYFLYGAGGTSGPQLSIFGALVTVGQYGSSWTVIDAEQVSGGYRLAWKHAPTDQYVIWNLDSGGGFVSNTLGTLFGTSLALQAQEPIFQQDLNGDGTIGPVTTMIETAGSTDLAQVADTYFLYGAGGTSGPQLSIFGALVTVGQYGSSWTVIGAEQVGVGYQLAWKHAATDQYVIWNLDSGGGFVSNTLGTLSGTSLALQSSETVFHQDLNGNGPIGPVTTMIETAGSTDLAQVADTYFLYGAGGTSGPQLSIFGAPVTVGQYGNSWTVIGADQVGGGYQLAWKHAPTDQYVIWNLDSSGSFVSNTLGTLSGTSLALQAQEAIFQQDLNGDTVIATSATTHDGWHL